ncbi:DUF2157 domain-containing protein [Sinobaca qinghaiensis]|nr:DUF2157 domain-containing protein [Sinobaca qinghaiensis]
MRTREAGMVQWTYVLGMALLIAAALVYMESWWHLFDRVEQAGVVFGFLLLLFVLAYLCRKKFSFFSGLSLLAGYICLGPAIALIGTIYHSQAESWWLLFFWLLPVMVVTLQVKMRSLLVLRFLLFQTLLWTIIFPVYYNWPEAGTLIGLLAASAVNASIYWWSLRKGKDVLLQHAWFTAVLWFPFCGAVRYVLPEVEVFAGTAYLAILAVSFYAVRRRPATLKITIVFTGLYAFQFLFITMMDIYSGAVFIIIFLFAAGAVYGSVKLISSFAKRGRSMQSKLFFLHTVTLVGALIAAGAFSGFVGLFLFEALPAVLFVSILVLFSFVLWKRKLDSSFAQAIVFFSMIQLVVLSADAAVWQMLPLLALTGWIWMRDDRPFYRIVVYGLANAALLTWLFLLVENTHAVVWTAAGLNILIAAEAYWRLSIRLLYLLGYLAALMLLFQLPYTVIETELLYWSYLFGYFLLLTGLLYVQVRQKDSIAVTITAVLWFVFLFTQYVDLFWTYVHLAFTLFLLGVGFLLTAYILEKKKQPLLKEAPLRLGKLPAAAVLLAAVILLIPAVQKEMVLQNGEVLWLEVEDYGPGYEEAENQAYINIYDGTYEENFPSGSYVHAQLEETENDSYRLLDIKADKEEAGSPSFRGRVNSWNGTEFGIDSYPAPEGEISHVLLRIGTDGVAVIEDVRYRQ